MPPRCRWPSLALLVALLPLGCKDRDANTTPNSAAPSSATTPISKSAAVKLTLDWKPEPEFGGFYAADLKGAYAANGLDVTIQSAGEGAPTWQLVSTGKT